MSSSLCASHSSSATVVKHRLWWACHTAAKPAHVHVPAASSAPPPPPLPPPAGHQRPAQGSTHTRTHTRTHTARRTGRRQPPRANTCARASTHTNADSMPGTLNCVTVHACGRTLSAATSFTTGVASGRQSRGASANLFVRGPQRRRNAGTAHAPAAAQHGHEYGRGGHAKCAGAAAECFVVRGRVVVVVVVVVVDEDDVVVVDVDGVDGASVVVVAAAAAVILSRRRRRRQEEEGAGAGTKSFARPHSLPRDVQNTCCCARNASCFRPRFSLDDTTVATLLCPGECKRLRTARQCAPACTPQWHESWPKTPQKDGAPL